MVPPIIIGDVRETIFRFPAEPVINPVLTETEAAFRQVTRGYVRRGQC
jgi:hypothetical protein